MASDTMVVARLADVFCKALFISKGLLMPKTEPYTITGVSLPRSLHLLIRRAARAIQAKQGGRVSASAIISDLIERHKDELTRLAPADR